VEEELSKRVLVCGAGGFIAGHLVRSLAAEGCWIRAVDRHPRSYDPIPVDEWLVTDLRDPRECARALRGGFDEVYQLAADMGGMEFISSAECEIMRNNALVNINMIDAAAHTGVGRYFFSSSVCVYRDMEPGEPALAEDDAYPAQPDNEYGWEKLYSERVIQAYGRRFDIPTRIARFQNCYGPEGAWRGGREKAPAALCRKVADADDGSTIEVFGGGKTTRQFVYVEDLVDAVLLLMRSNEERPTNIGTDDAVTIRELVAVIAEVAGKLIGIEEIDGPLGVQSRNFSHARMKALGWSPRYTLREGVERTYPWIEQQVLKSGDRSVA
jgi:nucleoside-diphosphate-sugar epimerase